VPSDTGALAKGWADTVSVTAIHCEEVTHWIHAWKELGEKPDKESSGDLSSEVCPGKKGYACENGF